MVDMARAGTGKLDPAAQSVGQGDLRTVTASVAAVTLSVQVMIKLTLPPAGGFAKTNPNAAGLPLTKTTVAIEYAVTWDVTTLAVR